MPTAVRMFSKGHGRTQVPCCFQQPTLTGVCLLTGDLITLNYINTS